MDSKMTSWTLNAMLGAMVASVLLLPSPAEIKKAIEFNHSDPAISLIERPDEPGALITISDEEFINPASIELSYDPIVDCLGENLTGSTISLRKCIPALVEAVVEHDNQAEQERMLGRTVRPEPKIEQMRLAVINVCRAQWAVKAGTENSLKNQDCLAVSQGVAY